ncbi:MPTX [Cervus elaphus hippelaphus]|uniref:MPTX n=1 Tax=Cervus elaphus hippelaphus TaxID=46360 RepID=A0A212CHM1_CEREH|nr:MPTX [Cervus elaphus hippelaphus]
MFFHCSGNDLGGKVFIFPEQSDTAYVTLIPRFILRPWISAAQLEATEKMPTIPMGAPALLWVVLLLFCK